MAQTLEADVAEYDDEEGGGKRRVLLRAALVAVVLAVGVVAYLLFGQGEGEGDKAAEEPVEGAVVEIGELTANLSGQDMRYARVSMAAVLRAEVEVSAVEQRFPVLKDAALSELATMSPEELRTADGLAEFKTSMTAHAQEAYPDDEVLRILVTELVVQ